jgi:hypothetical protein
MKKAANLLASERMTVKEAMRQVGISDISCGVSSCYLAPHRGIITDSL